MKTPSSETPELTAYALGELPPHQATGVHALLQASPAAVHELEQIEALTDALRQGAPLFMERLRPDQRHAVLQPAQLQRRPLPATGHVQWRRPTPSARPQFAGWLKAAAVVTVAGSAYWLGRYGDWEKELNVEPAVASQPAVIKPEVQVPLPVPETSAPLVAKVVPETPVQEVKPMPLPAKEEPLPEKAPVVVMTPAPTAPEPKVVAAVTPQVIALADKGKPAAVPSSFVTTLAKNGAFVSASRRAQDQFNLRPAEIRPRPAKGDKATLFSSLPARKGAEPRETSRGRTPDLYIHTWKAEVASCPWNEAHRLLRITLQLPADQPATMTAESYPLQVSFDPNCVREYRLLGERHQPADELRSAGTQVIWYEFQPNGGLEISKTFATVTLSNVRFTVQKVGPFDDSKLMVQDQGLSWQQARADFVFESAVVGFGLLLRGIPETPGLDHQLVLQLAEHAGGVDKTGERARFIRLVQDAKKAAGL